MKKDSTRLQGIDQAHPDRGVEHIEPDGCWNIRLDRDSSLKDYSSASSAKDFDASANRFITGLYEVLIERLETNNALQGAESASSAVLAKIEASRKVVKDNFDVGLAGMEHSDFPNKEAAAGSKTALQKAMTIGGKPTRRSNCRAISATKICARPSFQRLPFGECGTEGLVFGSIVPPNMILSWRVWPPSRNSAGDCGIIPARSDRS